MPHFMHQWTYKDATVLEMSRERENREEVVRIATEAFGGALHQFFFCLGEFDGMAITEFPNNETALACLMTVMGQGRLRSLKTTVLFTPEENARAIEQAHDAIRSDQTVD